MNLKTVILQVPMSQTPGKNIIRKQSVFKFWNVALLASSFILSRIIKKPIIWGKPMAISIEPTTACNLGCPECPSGLKQFSRQTGNIKTETNHQIIDQLTGSLSYINFYFQGEPFIHPNFTELVSYANSKGIYTATSTNAHFLTESLSKKVIESGLDQLIISIDGTTQEIYEQYRINGSLNKVLEGTKNIIQCKKDMQSTTPHVIFQFLVVQPNEHQIEDAKKMAKELGVNEIRFKTAQIYDYKNGNKLIPENEAYSRYKKQKDGSYQLKNKMSNHCWRMWSSCVMTWDGKIVPCCFDKDARHQIGDIRGTDFNSIWKGTAYNQFRKAILRNRKEIDICKNCSEGSKVWS